MLIINLSQDISSDNPYLSHTLLKTIEKNIGEKKKTILYLNKRWEFSSLICEKCNHIYKCDQCDSSFNVHKYPEKLVCHLCGKEKDIPTKCEKCSQNSLKKVWVWTQQIEISLKKIFKENTIFRFDTDSVKNKWEKEKALERLKEADIIIGTKMITTGFDFRNIWLIGIILLEQELLVPKYNTEEKVVSNIKQLIGRWWRKWETTEVLIQTFVPKNEIIQTITSSNYKDFFLKTLEERKTFHYTPFTQMATLEYRHKEKEKAKEFIIKLKNKLIDINSENTFEITLVPKPFKKNNQYFYKIIIKWDEIRNFIKNIKKEIFWTSQLTVTFE